MKSILISIKPEWVAKILNGEKTIEIRKTMPKCDLPIDVYIYCTKDLKSGKKVLTWLNEKGLSKVKTITYLGNDILGKVVAKFTLNKVEKFTNDDLWAKCFKTDELVAKSCVRFSQIIEYSCASSIYAWHIKDLEIFDEPKELNEFYKVGYLDTKSFFDDYFDTIEVCSGDIDEKEVEKCYKKLEKTFQLTKAPQNYVFIEMENQK